MRFPICYLRSKHSSVSCPWSLWKRQYLFRLRLLGSPFIFSNHFKEGSSLICIRTCSSGTFSGVYCWFRAEGPAFLLSRSFFSFARPFFGWGPCSAWHRICLRSFSSLPLLGYDRVFCIHEVLSRMDEFYHRLRLFFIKFMDEEIIINPIMECR